ncbi:MAG: VTT domain-containing protein [Syntrophobacteria bacterium]
MAAANGSENILVEGRNCWRIAPAARAALLIDAASYFAAFRAAVERARHSILIVGWDMDSRLRLVRDDRAHDLPVALGDFLNAVVSRRPGLHAHVLIWDFAMIYALERELLPVFKLRWRTHRRIHFRLDSNHPVGACHHQKIVVVDDAIAFVGGIDLATDRWDTPAHSASDPRREDPSGRRYPPHHDVQMAVDGPAAATLGDLVRERWRRATGRCLRPSTRGRRDPWPSELVPDMEDVRVAIARTEPAYRGSKEVREVESLYRDAIFAAHRFIYVENQYLTSATFCEALASQLRKRSGPEVVIVLPRRCSVWLEESTMGIFRARPLRRLREEDHYNRLRVFYPVVPGLDEESVNVHSKVLVIDDKLVRVGSSNLSNRSMGFDTECDICIEAGEPRIEEAIAYARNRLLAEHLGVAPHHVAKEIAARGSLIAAVDRLCGSERTLKPLHADVPEWVDNLIPDSTVIDPEKPMAPEKFIEQFISEEVPEDRRPFRRIAIILLAVLALASSWQWTPLGDWLDVKAIAAWAGHLTYHPAAPLVVIGAYLVGNLLLIPVTFMVAATAFIFGPVAGFILSMVGCLSGAMLTYGVGRLLGRDTVRRLAGTRLNRLSRRLANHGVITMATVRLVPVAHFAIASMVAGASHIRFRDFFLGTTIGMAPGVLAITVLEDRLEVAVREPGMASFTVLAVLVLLLVVSVLAIRRRLANRDAPGGAGKGEAET